MMLMCEGRFLESSCFGLEPRHKKPPEEYVVWAIPLVAMIARRIS